MVDAHLVSDRSPRMPEHRGPLSLLGRGWELFKDFWSVLRPMRFCVLVWIAISSLIIIVPQSQDALLALLEDTVAATRAGLADAAVFAALVFLWAFQTFYWARFVSRLPPRPHPPYRYPPLKRSAFALAVVTLALFIVSGFIELDYERALAFVIAAVWIAFGHWAASRIAGLPRSTIVMLRLNMIVFGLLFLVSIAPSTPLTGWLGFLSSPPIIMSVAAAWVFLGTFLLVVPGELLRLPITTIVIVLAVFFCVIGWRC